MKQVIYKLLTQIHNVTTSINSGFDKKKLTATVSIAVFFLFCLSYYMLNASTPKFIGMHDPDDVFTNELGITMNADYFAWNKDLSLIQAELQKANQEKRTFLVTLEPWPTPVGFKYESNDYLLKAVITGEYDTVTRDICEILSRSQTPVYIRWGHEMELRNSRYPWSQGTPDLYKDAYRHFVTVCRTYGSNFNFVWSPAGEIGFEVYWPGHEYVDVIGLSIYSYDQYDEKYVGHKRSFKEIFDPRYNLVKRFNKPVLIAEMGVTGTDSYKMEWIGWMMKDLHKYRQLIGIVYLNTLDPQAIWEEGLGNPDWRLPPGITSILFPVKGSNND